MQNYNLDKLRNLTRRKSWFDEMIKPYILTTSLATYIASYIVARAEAYN